MSRHRKRPAPRHRAPRHQAPKNQALEDRGQPMAQPMATHARPTPLGTAVRRVVVTPTFAAGLGVVIAAGMAYPMTKTVISYGGAPPAGGEPCVTAGCVGDSGELATASPGLRLETPPPPSPDPSPVPSGGGAVAAGPP